MKARKWECKNKEQYESKEKALEHIFLMNEESFGGHTFLRPYKCKYCKAWHLTSRDF